jgi:hypothetical protein
MWQKLQTVMTVVSLAFVGFEKIAAVVLVVKKPAVVRLCFVLEIPANADIPIAKIATPRRSTISFFISNFTSFLLGFFGKLLPCKTLRFPI